MNDLQCGFLFYVQVGILVRNCSCAPIGRSAAGFPYLLCDSAEFRGEPLPGAGLRICCNWNKRNNELSLSGRNFADRVAIIGGIDLNNLTAFVNEPRICGVEFSSWFGLA
jgi:hypothetical protein